MSLTVVQTTVAGGGVEASCWRVAHFLKWARGMRHCPSCRLWVKRS